ncbi:MAG: murein L,D-transpeptidase catalytic domain-containing protein [Pseudomonadota bacterium]
MGFAKSASWARLTAVPLAVGAVLVAAITVSSSGPALAQRAAQPVTLQSAQECLGKLRQSRQAFRVMADGLGNYYGRKVIGNKRHVILIDYTKHQTKDRLYVVDLATCKIVLRNRIIHGGAWYIYKAERPDPSWAYSRAKRKFYRRINLNTKPGMLTTCRNSVKGGSTHMTRPGWQYTGRCHPNANEGWTVVRTPSCTGYGVQVKPLQGQALGGVTLHDHIRLQYSKHVGQGSLGFQRGDTQKVINAIKGKDNTDISRGTLIYVHAPQCG